MKLVFTSYSTSPAYTDPALWLQRIRGYTGILEKLSRQHTVIGIERINFNGRLFEKGVLYYFLQLSKTQVRFPIRLHRLIRTLDPDIVFVNGFIFPLQIIQLRFKTGRRTKIIVINRSEKPATGWRKYLQKLADRSVDAYLFSSSEFGRSWMDQGIISRPEKIVEILHGSSHFLPGKKTLLDKSSNGRPQPVFLWVGRLDENKDPLTLVSAFIRYLQFQPGARLYMVYSFEGLLKNIRDILADSDCGDAITLLGRFSHAELETWYHRADFIISTSHYEGGGIAVCEAMSCGCIPLLSNIISFRKMTGPGHCGMLFEPGNSNGLLEALQKATAMDITRERQKTLEQFRRELSFEAIASKIETLIQSW